MGVINQGILGGLRKKVGSVVGASWKGIPVLKIYQPVVANPKTSAQVTVRTGFKSFAQLASIILAAYVKPLWDRFAVRMSGYNSFMKANGDFISEGDDPFSQEIIATSGKMDATAMSSATASASAIAIAWPGTPSGRYALADDKPYILVLNETTKKVVFAGMSSPSAMRSDASANIAAASFVNPVTAADVLHVYLSFLRSDGTVVSNSAHSEVVAS